MRPAILAVDGGNSKTDLALLRADGTLMAAVRGPTVSHQAVGLVEAGSRLERLASELAARAGLDPAARPIADLAVLCLAGMDLPIDTRHLMRVHGAHGLAHDLDLRNDTIAALRAGSPVGWGVAVILGAGINAVGVAPDGREARFAGLGPISGDRGGGNALGMWALGAAVRAQEARGPRTVLETLVPAHFGLRRPLDVTSAIYRGRVDERRVGELAAVAVAAAAGGDAVADALLEDLAAEAAGFATAAIRRLRLQRRPVPVILAGGTARGAGALLVGRVERLVRAIAPAATVDVLYAPPVVGAALLGLDRVAPGDAEAAARARAALRNAPMSQADEG